MTTLNAGYASSTHGVRLDKLRSSLRLCGGDVAFSLFSTFLSSLPLLAAKTNFTFKLGAIFLIVAVVTAFFVFVFLAVLMATIGPEDDAFSLRWIADRMSKKGRRRSHGRPTGGLGGGGDDDEDDEGFEHLSPGDDEGEEDGGGEDEDEEEETRWDMATASVAGKGRVNGIARDHWRWNGGGGDILNGRVGKYVASASPARTAEGGDGGGAATHWSNRNTKLVKEGSAASLTQYAAGRRSGNNGSHVTKQNSNAKLTDNKRTVQHSKDF